MWGMGKQRRDEPCRIKYQQRQKQQQQQCG